MVLHPPGLERRVLPVVAERQQPRAVRRGAPMSWASTCTSATLMARTGRAGSRYRPALGVRPVDPHDRTARQPPGTVRALANRVEPHRVADAAAGAAARHRRRVGGAANRGRSGAARCGHGAPLPLPRRVRRSGCRTASPAGRRVSLPGAPSRVPPDRRRRRPARAPVKVKSPEERDVVVLAADPCTWRRETGRVVRGRPRPRHRPRPRATAAGGRRRRGTRPPPRRCPARTRARRAAAAAVRRGARRRARVSQARISASVTVRPT